MNTVIEESLPRRHRITVSEYYRMGRSDAFAPDARMELIEGEIIDMAPPGSRHMAVVNWLVKVMIQAVGDHATVHNQGAVRLGHLSMPQPDLALLKPREDFYKRNFVKADHILLVVEVSDSSLSYDLGRKAPLYALYGVPEYWVFDIKQQQIHFFRSPCGESYSQVSVVRDVGRVAISQLPGVTVDLSWLRTLGAD